MSQTLTILKDPQSGGSLAEINTQFAVPRAGHTAHTLASGQVIFAGGVSVVAPESLNSVEIFTPDPIDGE